jgi:hypothetical protein
LAWMFEPLVSPPSSSSSSVSSPLSSSLTSNLAVPSRSFRTRSQSGISVILENELPTRVIKEGWLVKEGSRFKTWRRRWFSLRVQYSTAILSYARSVPPFPFLFPILFINLKKTLSHLALWYKYIYSLRNLLVDPCSLLEWVCR